MVYTIENEEIKVLVDSKGCEITSVMDKKTKKEYIWCGADWAWKRHAPVLFPLVGKYNGNISKVGENEFFMSQHGFARDMEFTCVKAEAQEISMVLEASEETKKKYPYDFKLTLGYELKGREIVCSYKVENPGQETMHFSIGGHPAFVSKTSGEPDNSLNHSNLIGAKIHFADSKEIEYKLLNSEGLVVNKAYELSLDEAGNVEITRDFFDKDALIVENSQCKEVSLVHEGKTLVTVKFDAPVFGLWSAAGKGVPFVCIEPWYGRTDAEGFTGDISEREWGNSLEAGKQWRAQYVIEIGE